MKNRKIKLATLMTAFCLVLSGVMASCNHHENPVIDENGTGDMAQTGTGSEKESDTKQLADDTQEQSTDLKEEPSTGDT